MAALALAIPCFATEYAFMGFDVGTQTMVTYIFSDAGDFHANVYMDQEDPGGYIGDYIWYADDVEEYYCDASISPWDAERSWHVPDGQENVISATVDFLDANYEYLYTLVVRDTLVSNLDEGSQDGWYTYRDGACTPVLPDTIRINSQFCATICHGTYTVPIFCESPDYDPSLVQVTVSNGCDPSNTHCDNPDCPGVDWNLFTYRIRVFPGCRIYLVMTYCGEGPGCVCIWRSDFELPVEMRSFDAIAGNGNVTVNWATASETESNQFVVSRSTSADPLAPYTEVYRGENLGSTATGRDYSWTDENVVNGITYYYKLHSIDANGNHVYNRDGQVVIASATPNAGLVGNYGLAQNFPNPFNSQTSFTFSIANDQLVSLKVFDLLGRDVATVVNKNFEAGEHTVNWTATGLSSGVYMYKLTAGSFTETKKLVFMK
jgi:hypothetical protein